MFDWESRRDDQGRESEGGGLLKGKEKPPNQLRNGG